MKANRKVMLGAALVVAIVALAGVGYAAVTLNAVTVSDNNDLTAKYVTAVQTDYSTFTCNLSEDTYNKGSPTAITYILQGEKVLIPETNLSAVPLGNPTTITITPSTGTSVTGLTLTADVESSPFGDGWTLYYKVGATGDLTEFGHSVNLESNATSAQVYVYLAGTAYSPTGNPGSIGGWTDQPSGATSVASVNDLAVIFTITATAN